MHYKSFTSLFVALFGLSSVFVVDANLVGGSQGQLYQFTCPTGGITQMRGLATTVITQIQFGCSDGTISQAYGGTAGNQFKMPFIPTGVKQIAVAYGNQIGGIAYGPMTIGGGGPALASFSDVNTNCPMIGATVGTDGTTIISLDFQFQCRSSITSEISQQQFYYVASNMKQQYQQAIDQVRNQYLTILSAMQQRVAQGAPAA